MAKGGFMRFYLGFGGWWFYYTDSYPSILRTDTRANGLKHSFQLSVTTSYRLSAV